MGDKGGTVPSKICTLNTLTENEKRWCAYGIALNHVLVPAIRPILDKEISKEYNDLVSIYGINVQTKHKFPSPKYPRHSALKYVNINGNKNKKKPPDYKYPDYSKFDYKVTSHVDFGMLFLQNYMAKLSAFDETCDASGVLTLFGNVPVFSPVLQNAADVVRGERNVWGHCNFTEWNELHFKKRFISMEILLKKVALIPADVSKVLEDLNDWKNRGVLFCMNPTIDPELVKAIQEGISNVEKRADESEEKMYEKLRMLDSGLQDMQEQINEIKKKLCSTNDEVDQLKTNEKVLQQEVRELRKRVSELESQRKSSVSRQAHDMGQSSDTSEVDLRVELRITGRTVKSRTCTINFDEFCGLPEKINLTVQLAVEKACDGENTNQNLELKLGSLLVIVHCFTYERFLEVLDDVESGNLRERLLKEFSLIGVEIEGMKIEIMNKNEVSKAKEALKKRNTWSNKILKAIKDRNLEEIRQFVESDLDVNLKIVQEMPLLHLASQFSSLDIVQYLVESGAKVTSEDDNCQETVLHSACRGGNDEIVEYLLQRGAEKDINKENHSGCSPLSIACSEGNTAVVRTLKKAEHGEVVSKESAKQSDEHRIFEANDGEEESAKHRIFEAKDDREVTEESAKHCIFEAKDDREVTEESAKQLEKRRIFEAKDDRKVTEKQVTVEMQSFRSRSDEDELRNGVRLMALIIDCGNEALRIAFKRCHPGNLQTALTRHWPILLGLKAKGIITQMMWDKIDPAFPDQPNIDDFSIPLLFVLLRNICGLLSPTSLGWDIMPSQYDHSVQADIVRINIFRNRHFSHVPKVAVRSSYFKISWGEISSALVRLGIHSNEIDRVERVTVVAPLIPCIEDEKPAIPGIEGEKYNNLKLLRLIVDFGTEALRKTFARYHPGNLHTVLSIHRSTLSTFKHTRALNRMMWIKLYPDPPDLPDLNKFDIVILSFLIRHICGLSSPALGWESNRKPSDSDYSVQADIIRIRLFRNQLFRMPNLAVSLADFNRYWEEISSVIIRLGINQNEIDNLRNERYEERLKERKDDIAINLSNDNLDDVKGDKEMFRSDSILKKHLFCCDFQTEIDQYHQNHTSGTREWLFELISTWFNDKTSESRAFVISGAGGMGKSVIAAVVCRRFSKYLGASYFFNFNKSRNNNPNVFLRSLSWQLCQALPEYSEALVKMLSGDLGQSLDDMNIEALFSILFEESILGVADAGKGILIVLDALDESGHHISEVVNLICNHMQKLPLFIRFLITTRPVVNLDEFKKLNPLCADLQATDDRNLYDLKLVIKDMISNANIPADHVDNFLRECDCNMLYASFLSKIYEEDPSKFSIDKLPLVRVEKYYERYVEKFKLDLMSSLQIPLKKISSFLCTLVAAKGPLPVAFIEHLFGFESSSEAESVIQRVVKSSYFLVIHENKSISFFHESVRIWLVNESENVDIQCGNKLLFDLCIKKLVELKERGVRDEAITNYALQYAIKYCIPHILNEPEDLASKVDSFVTNYVTDLEVMFASVLVDVDLTLENVLCLMTHNLYKNVYEGTRATMHRLFFLVRKFSVHLRDFPRTFFQNVVNEGGKALASKALTLLNGRYNDISYLSYIRKDGINNVLEACYTPSGTISSIDISPKHDYVACSYKEGAIELFSLKTGMSEWKYQDFDVDIALPVNDDDPCMLPHCVIFHPSQNLILPGRLDKTLTLQGKYKTGPFQCDEGCSKFTNSCLSPDSSKLATSYGNSLFIWDISSGKKERYLSCNTTLLSFSFTASGNFLGTTDIANVFNVYDVLSDYQVTSMQMHGKIPTQIVSTFEQNSWFCSDDQRRINVVNHDFLRPQDYHIGPIYINDVILPSNSHYFSKLQSHSQNLEQFWFRNVRNRFFGMFVRSSYNVFRYILIGNESVMVYSSALKIMLVFSLKGLIDFEEKSHDLPLVSSGISTNGNSVYFYDTSNSRFTIYDLDSNEKCVQPFKRSSQLRFLVMRNGVILFTVGDNFDSDSSGAPELWNSDLTQKLATFDQLSVSLGCLSVTDELIACFCYSSVTFFNVCTNDIESKSVCKYIRSVFACSSKYHVLLANKAGDISLWKDGTSMDDMATVISENISLREIDEAEFSPLGNRLALSSLEINKIFFFDVVDIQYLTQVSITGFEVDIIGLKFFDNQNLLCSSTNCVLYFINVERGELLTCLELGDAPGPIGVSREKGIVFAPLIDWRERFEIIKVCLPRK